MRKRSCSSHSCAVIISQASLPFKGYEMIDRSKRDPSVFPNKRYYRTQSPIHPWVHESLLHGEHPRAPIAIISFWPAIAVNSLPSSRQLHSKLITHRIFRIHPSGVCISIASSAALIDHMILQAFFLKLFHKTHSTRFVLCHCLACQGRSDKRYISVPQIKQMSCHHRFPQLYYPD